MDANGTSDAGVMYFWSNKSAKCYRRIFFYALGNTRITTRISFIKLIFLAIIIYTLANVSKLISVSWSVVLANLLCFLISFYYILKCVRIKKLDLFYIFSFYTLSTLCFVLHIYFLRNYILTQSLSFSIFIVLILVALSIYLICNNILSLFFKQSVLNMHSLFKEVLFGGRL